MNDKKELTYKEYAKKKYEEALKREHFDPEGNSTTATCNRGFFKQMRLNVPDVNNGFVTIIKDSIPMLCVAIAQLSIVLLAPITYPTLLLISTIYRRRRARKEMMQSYIDDKIDKRAG